jgi:hypothetical protein
VSKGTPRAHSSLLTVKTNCDNFLYALHVGGGGVVEELEVDRSAGEHDGGEGGLGAVEAVGPADDELYLSCLAFRPLDRPGRWRQ